jgi:hypothetical protein
MQIFWQQQCSFCVPYINIFLVDLLFLCFFVSFVIIYFLLFCFVSMFFFLLHFSCFPPLYFLLLCS